MLNIATAIWNQIAQEQPLLTAWARQVFPLDAAALAAALEQEATVLRATGEPGEVILAFQVVRPLVLEQQALWDFVQAHPDLRGWLPEMATVEEAVCLARMEYGLDETALARVRALLTNAVHEQLSPDDWPVERDPPPPSRSTRPPGYGEHNKIVTREQAEVARKCLRELLAKHAAPSDSSGDA